MNTSRWRLRDWWSRLIRYWSRSVRAKARLLGGQILSPLHRRARRRVISQRYDFGWLARFRTVDGLRKAGATLGRRRRKEHEGGNVGTGAADDSAVNGSRTGSGYRAAEEPKLNGTGPRRSDSASASTFSFRVRFYADEYLFSRRARSRVTRAPRETRAFRSVPPCSGRVCLRQWILTSSRRLFRYSQRRALLFTRTTEGLSTD